MFNMRRRIHDFLPQVKDLYEIDENAHIYSDNIGEMKTRFKKNSQYVLINLMRIDGRKQTFRVHRLVALAFLPIPSEEYTEVNHKNGIKDDNRLDNLEWCTTSQNQHHAFLMRLQKPRREEDSNLSKLSTRDVRRVFMLRAKGLTQRQIALIVGCTRSNISYILNHKTWNE